MQAFEGEVVLPGLALVGDEHQDDDDEEETSAGRDADDGREGQQAVGQDVHCAGGDVETPDLNLSVKESHAKGNPALKGDFYIHATSWRKLWCKMTDDQQQKTKSLLLNCKNKL